MWLSKLRQAYARYFALTMVAAALAALVAIGLVIDKRGYAPHEALLAATARVCRLSAPACAQGLAAGDPTDIDVLPNLSDRFVYRARPTQAEPGRGYGKTLTVGAGKDFPTITLAVGAAHDGDIIAIAPGTYRGESVIIARNDLILRGQDGIATLAASHHPLVQNKAILITQGRNLLLENLELSGADSSHHNGAGIRAEGLSLHVRQCFIHDNQAGILVSNRRDSTVLVEYSEFARNGHRDGQAHQIYAGLIAQLTLRFNYIHDSFVGSAIKSRAARSVIEYNFVADGARGSANYTIDLSNGGDASLVGNVLEKASHAQNHTFVSYAPESLAWQKNTLAMVHNTLVNDRVDGNFINNHSDVELHATNNLFIGRASLVTGGPVQLLGNMVMGNTRYTARRDERLDGSSGSSHNLVFAKVSVADRAQLDYRLTPSSPAINAAAPLTGRALAALAPVWQYRHPADREVRRPSGASADVGAFEFIAPTLSN